VFTHPEERIVVDARRHGIVLIRPLARAGAVAVAGAGAMLAGWPFSAGGVVLLIVAALVATSAVWRWDRTHVVLTSEKLFVVHGVVRRRAAAVRLERIGTLELEQSLIGRLFGYGTLFAGELEIPYVPEARRVAGLVERLSH
jgi:membrane protein YdbS with pleckstrin-like domain